MRLALLICAFLTGVLLVTTVTGSAAKLTVRAGTLQVFSFGGLCGPVEDASLEFRPDEMAAGGAGPVVLEPRLGNSGEQSDAVDVVVKLSTLKGHQFIESVELPGGELWQVGGQLSTFALSVGAVAAGGEIDVPLVVHMTPGWSEADGDAEAKIRAVIDSARCTRMPPPAKLTVTIARGTD